MDLLQRQPLCCPSNCSKEYSNISCRFIFRIEPVRCRTIRFSPSRDRMVEVLRWVDEKPPGFFERAVRRLFVLNSTLAFPEQPSPDEEIERLLRTSHSRDNLVLSSHNGHSNGPPPRARTAPCVSVLRSLCDANHWSGRVWGGVGEVHAGLTRLSVIVLLLSSVLPADRDGAHVLQSIASVIQVLPPTEEIVPIEAMVSPLLHKLVLTLTSMGTACLLECARAACILQLEILAGVVKGLTRMGDPLHRCLHSE
ncbi:hypothetical protein C8J57DRAFT_1714111 [Mycena rebaudengoi]|nr:hypothetical protein C8J57DRAFT_1714111 [Mycena rebaudengoi]